MNNLKPVVVFVCNCNKFLTAELGDYQPEEHGPNYLSNLQLIPGQTEDMERKISELHKLHKLVDCCLFS